MNKIEPLNLTVYLPKDEHEAFEQEFQEFVEIKRRGRWTREPPTIEHRFYAVTKDYEVVPAYYSHGCVGIMGTESSLLWKDFILLGWQIWSEPARLPKPPKEQG